MQSVFFFRRRQILSLRLLHMQHSRQVKTANTVRMDYYMVWLKLLGAIMASFPIRTSFEKMFLCQISSVSSRRIRLLLKNFTSDFVSHCGNSSKKWSPNIWARQVHTASHSVIIWWGVSSSNKSSHNLQETSPGGGEIPWNTIAFCLLRKACPVRNRATRPTLSLER